jgi:hypothetical protein
MPQQQVHIGVDPNFRANKKAFPAFIVFDPDNLQQTLLHRGCEAAP